MMVFPGLPISSRHIDPPSVGNNFADCMFSQNPHSINNFRIVPAIRERPLIIFVQLVFGTGRLVCMNASASTLSGG